MEFIRSKEHSRILFANYDSKRETEKDREDNYNISVHSFLSRRHAHF